MQPPCPQSGRRNGALHALWRAAPRRERRGAREKRFDQDRRTIHGWHHEGGGASSELPERARMDTSFPARVAVACVAWDGTRPADTESSSRSGWPAPKCDYRTEARLSDEVQSPHRARWNHLFFPDRAVLPCENLTIAEPLSTDQRCPRTSQRWGGSAFSRCDSINKTTNAATLTYDPWGGVRLDDAV